MSFCYSFPKQGVSLDAWQEKIGEFISPAEPGQTSEGAWRELLISSMVRDAWEDEDDGMDAKYLAEGSIRGVLVRDEGDGIDIILHTFASRSDHALAARMAWEAMSLGATVSKEDHGEIQPSDLNAETIESTYREWFALSKASVRNLNDCRLPIYDFLSIAVDPADCDKDDDTLAQELIAKVAGVGDAFLSSRLVIGVDGDGQKLAGILQPEMPSLMLKDIEAVAFDGGLVPIEDFVAALGDDVIDGHGCWILPAASTIAPAILESLTGKGFTSTNAANQGPTDEEWNFIAQGPVLAFLMVAAADGSVDKKEVEGFAKVLGGLAAQQQHEAVSRMMRTAQERFHEVLPRLIQGQTDPMQVMQALTMLLNDRFSPEDAKIMKISLVYLAREVAAASGGFLGFGPKISKDEKKAIAALVHMLGLDVD